MHYTQEQLHLSFQGETLSLMDDAAHQLLSWWIIRMMLLLNGVQVYIEEERYMTRVRSLLNLPDTDQPATIIKALQTMANHQQAQGSLDAPMVLGKNIEKISKLLGLNETERWLLCFGVLLKNFDVLEDAVRMLGDLNTLATTKALSTILGLPLQEVKQALSPESKLARTGMLQIDKRLNDKLDRKIDLLSPAFADNLYSCDEDVHELVKESVCRCSSGTLTRSDYAYVDSYYEMTLNMLRAAFQSGRKGTNILIYGAPGTGKTEMAKLLAQELEVKLYEISYIDADNEPTSKHMRLKAFSMAQSIFENEKILLMFDEAEDIFGADQHRFSFAPKKQSNKAWFNRMLEHSTVPTVWLCNSIAALDPAVARRFDIVFEMPIPPKGVRISLIEQTFGGRLNQETKHIIAAHEALAPALLSRSAEVLSVLKSEGEDASKEALILLNATLQAQGHKKLSKNMDAYLPGLYNPEYINTTIQPEDVMQGIACAKSARICLYGAPGTGKSAYCRYVADKLGKPLLLKRASDLISPWVGMTEENIAQAFEEAGQEGAVLVIDEVDSFLQDRGKAQRSWEVSQVNEMLTQMEAYEGIFFATTNLMEGLDQAALRRFDMKLKFLYLRSEQALGLLERHAAQLGLKAITASDEARLRRLTNLAPGDFNAIRRQSRFHPIASASDFITRLEQECVLKAAEKRAMGFCHQT
ncbi:MAG: ATP-binding protein [Campylobacterales bacterium]|nr:ATP-binding protein [Campylobacterales bacterium]